MIEYEAARVWALQLHIELDEVPTGQYVRCCGCDDFLHLPASMDFSVWFDRMQDFTFEHDTCDRRWKERQRNAP